MKTKKYSFPKGVVKRDSTKDYTFGGNKVKYYLYKNSVEFTIREGWDWNKEATLLIPKEFFHIDIPFHYGIEAPAKYVNLSQEFNGVEESEIDIDKFLANCEEIYKVFVENFDKNKSRIEEAKKELAEAYKKLHELQDKYNEAFEY